MRQRLRGPGITLNYKSWDTFFQIVTTSKQIVVPSNKQRLSKVYVLLLDEEAQNDNKKDAFRSCAQGTGVGGVGLGIADRAKIVGPSTQEALWDQQSGLLSAQF